MEKTLKEMIDEVITETKPTEEGGCGTPRMDEPKSDAVRALMECDNQEGKYTENVSDETNVFDKTEYIRANYTKWLKPSADYAKEILAMPWECAKVALNRLERDADIAYALSWEMTDERARAEMIRIFYAIEGALDFVKERSKDNAHWVSAWIRAGLVEENK